MDVHGAVDLRVVSSELQLKDVSVDKRTELRLLAQAQTGSFRHPGDWTRAQLTLLLAASVLESYLLHLRGGRLARFELSRHPDLITLGQLAHLRREHPGTAGQSFEVAIADSVNAGISAVIEPIRQALRLLNLKSEGPIGMVLLGLEKVGPDDRRTVYDLVAQRLPSDARLRGGGPGRPAKAATVIKRLSELSWHSLTIDERLSSDLDAERSPRQSVSQLGRADALLYCGASIVPVSMKIRGVAVDLGGWRDVPLWITTTPLLHSDAYRSPVARCPTVVVRMSKTGFYTSIFISTVEAVDCLLSGIDVNVVRPSSQAVRLLDRRLRRFIDRPLSETLNHLRESAHSDVGEILGDLVHAEGKIIEIPVLDNAVIKQAFTDQAFNRQLFTLQDHLWVAPKKAA